MYIDKDNPEHVEDRLHIIPGKSDYLFVYPFVKTREWYSRNADQRQEMMDEHIRIGSKYRSVKLHTTYSFGLDDQEFVVAFETDNPADFLDLVQELRETKASSYTLRDTPMFTCRQRSLARMFRSTWLGKERGQAHLPDLEVSKFFLEHRKGQNRRVNCA